MAKGIRGPELRDYTMICLAETAPHLPQTSRRAENTGTGAA